MCNKVEKCPLFREAGISYLDLPKMKSKEQDKWIAKLCFKYCPIDEHCIYEERGNLTAKEMDLFNEAIERMREDESKSSTKD